MRSKKIKKAFAVLVYGHHMVKLGCQNKITDFLIIFALASPFKFPVLNRNKFTIKLQCPIVIISIQRPINMITVTVKLSKGVFPSFASY